MSDFSISAAVLESGGNTTYLNNKLRRFDILSVTIPLEENANGLYSPTIGRIAPALNESLSRNDTHCIILVNTLKTSFSANGVYSLISSLAEKADIVNLAVYADRCHLNRQLGFVSYRNNSLSLVRNFDFSGFMAIMLSAPIVEQLIDSFESTVLLNNALETLVENGNQVISTLPNLFEFDYLNYATREGSFSLQNRCLIPEDDPSTISLQTYAGVGLAAILLFAIGWGLYRIGPNNRASAGKEEDMSRNSMSNNPDNSNDKKYRSTEFNN